MQSTVQTTVRRFGLACALPICLTTAPAAMATEAYVFDRNHTEIRFSWDHLGFSTTSAYFREMSGTLMFDEDDPTASSVEVVIDATSLDTGRPEFTEELKTETFFHVEEYPEARFVSTGVHAEGDGRYRVDGELTIRGVTRDASLDVRINEIGDNPVTGAKTVGFDAETEILRSEFGLDEFVPMVGDNVIIHISSEMPREADFD